MSVGDGTNVQLELAILQSLTLSIPYFIKLYETLRANHAQLSDGTPVKTVSDLLTDAANVDLAGMALADSEIAAAQDKINKGV